MHRMVQCYYAGIAPVLPSEIAAAATSVGFASLDSNSQKPGDGGIEHKELSAVAIPQSS